MSDQERLAQVTLATQKDMLDLKPGEVTCDAARRYWFVCCPDCHHPGSLARHIVAEGEGTITVTPSILCSCGAHYFIEANQIRWA